MSAMSEKYQAVQRQINDLFDRLTQEQRVDVVADLANQIGGWVMFSIGNCPPEDL